MFRADPDGPSLKLLQLENKTIPVPFVAWVFVGGRCTFAQVRTREVDERYRHGVQSFLVPPIASWKTVYTVPPCKWEVLHMYKAI